MRSTKRFDIPRLVRQLCWSSLLIGLLALLVPAPGAHVGAAGPAVLVKDIYPGPDSSIDSGLFFYQNPGGIRGQFIFSIQSGGGSEALLKSDGTEAGTLPLGSFQSLGSFINVNDTLFFSANNQLWRSDATEDGTRQILSSQQVSFVEFPTNVNGTIYFRAVDAGGWGLWKSDGTTEGTVLIQRYGLPITNLAGSERLLFYTSDEGIDGFSNGLWRSDGTPAGTQLLKIFPPIEPPSPGSPRIPSASSFTDVNGEMFFLAYTAGRGFELWKSDGTTDGTKLVSDAGPTMAYGDIWYLKNVNQTLFMLVDHAQQNTSLWSSDGSADGTKQIKLFTPGTSAVDVTYFNTMQDLNGTLLFALYPAGAPPTGRRLGELWKSDGTSAGTIPINEHIYHGFGATVACGKLYFSGGVAEPSGNPQDIELWQTDGTTAGTTQVQDIAPGTASSDPRSLTAVGQQLFFSANDGTSGRELWVLPIARSATSSPPPAVPLPHQIFLPHTQIDASC